MSNIPQELINQIKPGNVSTPEQRYRAMIQVMTITGWTIKEFTEFAKNLGIVGKSPEPDTIREVALAFCYLSQNMVYLAGRFGVSPRTINRWGKTSEWREVIEREGCGHLKWHKINHQLLMECEKVYRDAGRAGMAQEQIAGHVERVTGTDHRTVRRWSRKFSWRENATT